MNTNRRNFMHLLGASGLGFGTALNLNASTTKDAENNGNDDQQLFIGDDIAVAKTVYGKVKGLLIRKIFEFRGIRYGADTGGKNRFMPPQKPEPWNDIQPAVWWGNTAPQDMENRYSNVYSSYADHWNYDDVSEDCLKLNVWTPGLDDGEKRPVLVWFHGGGYRNGNAIEQDGYMGENLARKGDIVFVSVNHRLGPIGFSDFSGVGGSKYKHSANVGALDMVASLEWVQENIAFFGGDLANVTIMGQSGGGSKVCTLAAMPAAAGLIHKVVPLSGSSTDALDQDYSRKIGEYILKEANLKSSELDKLQEMDWKSYLALANRAVARFNETQGNTLGFRGGFRPVADGISIPKGTFYSDPNGVSSQVPMLICSTFHEWAMSRTNPEVESITAAEAIERLKGQMGFRAGLGDKAPEVYQAYSKVFPEAKPIEIMCLISSNRAAVIKTANAKGKQKAPVYNAWFGWEPNMFDGRMRAFHCIDICFWFNNTDLMLTHTGGGARPRSLSSKMSDALLQFMRTGNPNVPSLPQWDAYNEKTGAVMILDDACVLMNDPDREARISLG